jgi:response regulator RpfG family c-di-GMP phosphodiesterase
MSDELMFEDEENIDPQLPSDADHEPWKILVVDDDQSIHDVTNMVLRYFKVDGRPLQMMSAYSADEAKKMLQEHQDIAIAILDVVMEEDEAGLKLAHYIREELGNHFVRIVLRTGQPGQAPEAQVIERYDINDYKEKTELTTQKLKTMCISLIRSYRDIRIIEDQRQGLERLIEATNTIFEASSLHVFASAILEQMVNVLRLEANALYCRIVRREKDMTRLSYTPRFHVLAAGGKHMSLINHTVLEELPTDITNAFQQALEQKQNIITANYVVCYYCTSKGSENVLYIEAENHSISNLDRKMLDMYSTNVALCYENLTHRESATQTQIEMVNVLTSAIESHAENLGSHAQRVRRFAVIIAAALGFSAEEIELLATAAPLHDIGKIAIPSSLLQKPGPLTESEQSIMKTHTQVGYEMLIDSQSEALKLAANIAYQHHERWDGKGYPKGLKGEEIDVAARIICAADVIDALGTRRVYGHAWAINEIFEFIEVEAGKQFDPQVARAVMAERKAISEVFTHYPE